MLAWKHGRAARLPAAPVSEYTFGWEVPYDYWQERLGRTVLWAAGKLPPVPLILRREGAPAVASGTQLSGSRLSYLVPRHPAIARLRIRERRDDGLVVRELTRSGASSGHEGPSAIGLPAGHYHDDVIATDAAGRVVAWATLPFTVASERTVSLDLPKAWGEIGETIAGSIRLGGAPLKGETVLVELRDRRGRIIARTAPTGPYSDAVPFSFPIPAWYPMLVQIRAVVRDHTGEAADAVAYFNVTKRHRGQFNFLSWDVPSGPTAAWAHEALARLGVTMELAPFRQGKPPRVMAAYEMAAVPYTTRILAETDARGWIKPVPWNQEPEIDRYVQGLASKYQPARQHGVFVYSLGDETVTRGSDASPSDLAAYRRYLQSEYGTIAALNESWGSDYSSFPEIRLLDPSDPTEQQAKREGHYARWYDRQAWASADFLKLCRRFGDAYRKMDPQALTGFEGAGRLQDGLDVDGIVRTNGFWTPYPGPGDQVLRGIAPRDFPRSNWMGYTKDADSLIWSYWRMILNGSDSVWWWRWDNIGRFMGLLRPDLTPPDEVRELMADTRIVREGLGDLLLHSQMETDGITLLYSQPSIYAAQVADGPSYGDAATSHAAWHRALFNLGFSFNYVTDAMLRRGQLDPQATKVLILPRAEALSDEAARTIQAFVEAGGTVIADLRPGRYTAHLKPRAAGALDALFGADTQGSSRARNGVTLDAQLSPSQVPWRFGGMTVDPGVKPTEAKSLGESGGTPVLLTRAVGKGRAILLNFALARYPHIGSADASPGAAKLLLALLAPAGVRPAMALARVDGKPTGDVRVQRWRNGETEVVGIAKEPERGSFLGKLISPAPPEFTTYTLTLPTPRRAYDLRQHRDLGGRTNVQLQLRPGHAVFLALLPDAAPEILATIEPSEVHPGETPALRLTMPTAVGDTAVLITVQRPNGVEADFMRIAAVVPRDGTLRAVIPIAINDPEGLWTIRIRRLYGEQTQPLLLRIAPISSENDQSRSPYPSLLHLR